MHAFKPRTVIYDPELTFDLPPSVSAASGVNAVAHCVEASVRSRCESGDIMDG
jgi:alcohol dehydrogenase class IV